MTDSDGGDADDNGDEFPGERWVAPEGNNYAMGNDGGAPEGNQNAVGNAGGRPPDGNQNAARHHLYSQDPGDVLAYLKEHHPDDYWWVQDKAAGYLDDAPFEPESPKADQLLQVAVREYAIWRASGIQVREGVLTKTHIRGLDGEFHEVTREHPVNQPLDRMEGRVTQRLKELGVFDDPDSQAAAATATESYEIVDVESESVGAPGGDGT